MKINQNEVARQEVGKKFKILILVIIAVLILQLFPLQPANAQMGSSASGVTIRDFQLVSEEVGWLLIEDQLFWTGNSGNSWNEITPSIENIQKVYFVDRDHGWVLHQEFTSELAYNILITDDGGQSWDSSTIDQFALNDVDAFSPGIQLSFMDQNRGWVVLKRVTSSNFSDGTLYVTEDGGQTWQQRSIPIGEPAAFTSELNGWTAGGATGEEFYRTIDGGQTWKKEAVTGISPNRNIKYGLPLFGTEDQGILPVLVESGNGVSIRFFSTADGGETWDPGPAKKIADEAGISPPVSMVGSAGFIPIQNKLIKYDAASGKIESQKISLDNINDLEMVSLEGGWAKQTFLDCSFTPCIATDSLFITLDGGESWQAVKLPKTISTQARSLESINQLSATDYGLVPLGKTSFFTGQGFDKCEIPTLSQLQTWYKTGPYQAVNLYFGGSSRACLNSALSASYLSSMSQQGWKFIPTWVGPQAPCTGFSTRMSYNTTTAYNQGVAEANSALQAAKNLGLADANKANTVIYYDLEGWSGGPGDTSCLNAAKAFINGWSERMQAMGNLAGVYGSAWASALSEYATIANPPDVLWPAHWVPPYTYKSDANVWNVYSVDNTLWPDHQRIRQYVGSHNETWGGITFNIDSNVIDGIVADLSANPLSFDLLNSSFEDAAIDPWAFKENNTACNSAVLTGSAEAYHGTQYLAVNENGNDPDCVSLYQDVIHSPEVGDLIRYAVWVRAANAANPRSLTLGITSLGGGAANEETNGTSYTSLGDKWACIETSLSVQNAGNSTLRFEVGLESNDSANYHFDLAQISKDGSSLCPQPIPPSNFTASDGTFPDKVRLDWDPVLGAEYYKIYRANSLTGQKSLITSTSATIWDDSTMTVDLIYYYWVRSCVTSGCSNLSPPETGYRMFIPGSPTPITPGGLVNGSSFLFTWDGVVFADDYGLVIQSGGQTIFSHWYPTNEVCSSLDCAINPGVTFETGDYSWYLLARNARGTSSPSTAMPFSVSSNELLSNTSFESYLPTKWTWSQGLVPGEGPDCGSGNARTGDCAWHYVGDGNTKEIRFPYRYTGSAGGSYTVSIWRKGLNVPAGGVAFLRLVFINTDSTKSIFTVPVTSGNYGVWEQFSDTFAAPKNYTRINVSLISSKPSGTLWWDDISVVHGGAEQFPNTSFEYYLPTTWTWSQGLATGEGPDCGNGNANIGDCAWSYIGDGNTKEIRLPYRYVGTAGDSYTVSIWRKGMNIPAGGTAFLRLVFINADGTKTIFTEPITSGDYGQWEQFSDTFVALKDYTRINVSLISSKPSGTLWWDDISVVRGP